MDEAVGTLTLTHSISKPRYTFVSGCRAPVLNYFALLEVARHRSTSAVAPSNWVCPKSWVSPLELRRYLIPNRSYMHFRFNGRHLELFCISESHWSSDNVGNSWIELDIPKHGRSRWKFDDNSFQAQVVRFPVLRPQFWIICIMKDSHHRTTSAVTALNLACQKHRCNSRNFDDTSLITQIIRIFGFMTIVLN